MEWSQTLTIIGTTLGSMSWGIGAIYRLNQNTIKEWRDEHSKQIDKVEERINKNNEKMIKEWRDEHSRQIANSEKMIKEWRDEHSRQIANSEKHWRELFMHFNGRLDQGK